MITANKAQFIGDYKFSSAVPGRHLCQCRIDNWYREFVGGKVTQCRYQGPPRSRLRKAWDWLCGRREVG